MAVCAVVAIVGCGKKGNPIAPIVRIPAPVEQIAATRLGNDVYVTLTVPKTNIDASLPADIGRIDVYGYTGRIPPLKADWTMLGEVVGSIRVAPPPFPDRPVPLPEPGVIDPEGAVQGTPAVVHDVLTPEELVQGRVAPVVERRQRTRTALVTTPVVEPPLKRFYLAIPFSRRGQPGPPGAQSETVLITPPEPPISVQATYTATTLTLTWEPAGGLLGFLLDRSLPPEPAPYDAPVIAIAATGPVDTSTPPGPTLYNVYREVAPDPLELPALTEVEEPVALPAPLSPGAVAAPSIVDSVEFGRERCYVVRGQRTGPAGVIVMSEPSDRVCLTPVDIFPPATPTGLASVPAEGAISLIWEPNSEADLGGYLVLRGEVGDATLRLLTETPVFEARYRDATVAAGTRYVYAVIAVDSQLPLPNVSAPSLPVEETAR